MTRGIERQRRLQELALQRAAVLVVPGRLTVGIVRPHGRQSPAVVLKHGRLQFAVADELAVARRALEQHLEAIAGLEVGVEVHFAAEDRRHLERELHVLARPLRARR